MWPLSSSVRKTFLSPCSARLSSMATHHLHQTTSHLISLNCSIAIGGCCITWSPSLANLYCPFLIELPVDYYTQVLMMMLLHDCSQAIIRASPRIGIHFPGRILGGYHV